MKEFFFAVNGIMPIIILVAVGYLLKKLRIFNDNFLSVANKVCFKVFLPCMLFINIYTIKDFTHINWQLVLFAVIATLIIFALGLVIGKLSTNDLSQRGVIAMCVFRPNSVIIGLSLVTSIYGEIGGGTMALLLAFTIPLFNILSIITFSVYNKNEKLNVGKTLLNLIKNPLTISILIAFGALFVRYLLSLGDISFRLTDISFIYQSIKTLGGLATPLALLVLGGQFAFSSAKQFAKPITIGVLCRLVIMPIATFIVAYYFFDFTQIEFACLMCLFAAPLAVTSVVMASEMNSSAELAGQLVVWTTLLSFVTLFVYIMTFGSLGLI
ncbi:MAG: AEC family transporter [Clostridia bacterium]